MPSKMANGMPVRNALPASRPALEPTPLVSSASDSLSAPSLVPIPDVPKRSPTPAWLPNSDAMGAASRAADRIPACPRPAPPPIFDRRSGLLRRLDIMRVRDLPLTPAFLSCPSTSAKAFRAAGVSSASSTTNARVGLVALDACFLTKPSARMFVFGSMSFVRRRAS